MFRAKLRTLVCKPPVNCSVTHKPLDNKNNGTCYDCYQFVIKRLIEIAETRINTGFFKQLDLFEFCNLNEFSISELKIILQASPSPNQILQPTPQNIRITIPRWTPSKYHSGRIADIVTDVYEKIDRALPGIYIYNSNLNPKNARSLNDLYVLVIVENSIRWYDINRRCNYSFSKPTITEEVYTHVENSFM